MKESIIESLKDRNKYLVSTLLACLIEARRMHNLPLQASYRTILRRESSDVEVYTKCTRDQVSKFRMYTGSQIKKIIEYEVERTKAMIDKGTYLHLTKKRVSSVME